MTSPEPTRRDPDAFAPDVENVVRHMIGCSPCRETMSLLDGEPADAMLAIASDRGERTLVQGVLGMRAVAGKLVVADLVYEMAKACLMSDVEAARKIVCTRPAMSPDEAARLVADAAPQSGLVLPAACLEAPLSVRGALDVASDVLTALQVIEGASPRFVLLTAVIQNTQGHFQIAEKALRELDNRGLDRQFRTHVRSQLSRSLIGQIRGSEALAVANEGLESDPNDATLTLNAILASAQAGETSSFRALLTRFRGLSRSGLSADELRFAQTCVSTLVANLSMDDSNLRLELGIDAGDKLL